MIDNIWRKAYRSVQYNTVLSTDHTLKKKRLHLNACLKYRRQIKIKTLEKITQVPKQRWCLALHNQLISTRVPKQRWCLALHNLLISHTKQRWSLALHIQLISHIIISSAHEGIKFGGSLVMSSGDAQYCISNLPIILL